MLARIVPVTSDVIGSAADLYNDASHTWTGYKGDEYAVACGGPLPSAAACASAVGMMILAAAGILKKMKGNGWRRA